MSIEKQTFKRGPLRDVFAEGVRVGNILYLAGQVGIDSEGRVGTTIAEQTRLAYVNVASILAHFDATMGNVVDETLFVTNISELLADAAAFTVARSSFYGEKPDVTQTLVQVAGLFRPEFKIEIKCIAHL
jgi:enamine deaminase RidA (YjgF/YER057c/UK114 family)